MRAPVKEREWLEPVHPVIPGECVLFLGEVRVCSVLNFAETVLVFTGSGRSDIPVQLPPVCELPARLRQHPARPGGPGRPEGPLLHTHPVQGWSCLSPLKYAV